MPYTDLGRRHFMDRQIGVAVNAIDTTTGYMGVGDSSTAFNASQTDLQAATNKLRKLLTTSSRSSDVITYVTSFSTGEANWAWNEVGVSNAVSGANLLIRFVQSLGTKASGTWTLTTTQTVSSS
jgi:hypothetical protein